MQDLGWRSVHDKEHTQKQSWRTASVYWEEWLCKEELMPLGRYRTSLGQGAIGYVPLARAMVLEDASSTYSGSMVWQGRGEDKHRDYADTL